MTEKKIVVGFGSKVEDTTAIVPEHLHSALKKDLLDIIASDFPDIGLKDDITDDRLYPAVRKILEKYQDQLDVHTQEGGSVFNSFSAAKTLLGRKVNDVEFHHIPTSNVKTIILALGSQKIMVSHRPKNDATFSDAQKILISKADVFFAPKSSFNGNPDQIKEAFNLLKPTAKVFATFHGSGLVKNISLMLKAHAWAGNAQELGDASYTEAHAAFAVKGGLAVKTDGENGLEVISGDPRHCNFFRKKFPALPVQNIVNTAGAGNGVEGTVIVYLLGMGLGNTLDERLLWLGHMANAASGIVLTFAETALQPKHLPDIVDRYHEHIKAACVRLKRAARHRDPAPPV